MTAPRTIETVPRERGVYVDRGVNGSVEITTVHSTGRRIAKVDIDAEFYDDGIYQAAMQWLEMKDPRGASAANPGGPTLHLCRGAG